MPDDTTLTVIFGFLLAAGGGLMKGYQWYVLHKESLKDKKATATLRTKNRELNASKKLNIQLEKEIRSLREENQSLRETLQSALAGRREG